MHQAKHNLGEFNQRTISKLDERARLSTSNSSLCEKTSEEHMWGLFEKKFDRRLLPIKACLDALCINLKWGAGEFEGARAAPPQ
jgi:hypothetical protein